MPKWWSSSKNPRASEDRLNTPSEHNQEQTFQGSHTNAHSCTPNGKKQPFETSPINRSVGKSDEPPKYRHSLRVPKKQQGKSELIVLLSKDMDKRDVIKRLKARGFVVTVMQEDFCALFVGAKLTRDLALEGDILPDLNGIMPVGFRAELIQLAVQRVVRSGVASKDHIFPVHDLDAIEKLKAKKDLTVSDIRAYFGSSTGLYFAWIDLYTKSLVLLTLVCTGVYLYQWQENFRILYNAETFRQKSLVEATSSLLLEKGTEIPTTKGHALFISYFFIVAIWSSCFVESWKRQQAELARKWNNLGKFVEDGLIYRAKHLDELKTNFSSWQKLMIIVLGYCLTVGVNFYVVMYIQKTMDEYPGEYFPIILASLWPLLAGFLNNVVTPVLNHLEGHQTEVGCA